MLILFCFESEISILGKFVSNLQSVSLCKLFNFIVASSHFPKLVTIPENASIMQRILFSITLMRESVIKKHKSIRQKYS